MCSSCGDKVHDFQDGSPGSAPGPHQVWDGNSPYVGCCVVDEGYYCVWGDKDIAMECEEWAELCTFRRVVNQISHISFQVVSERDRARTALNNLARDAPFERCKRFPLGKAYVNLSCSTYAAILQTILGALDFKDRESEKEMKYSVKREQDDKDQSARRSYSIDDASTAYRKNLRLLQDSLCKRDEVYTRWSFERKYELTWCKGKCPFPSEGGGSQPPSGPNEPVSGSYGELMKVMEKAGLNVADFSVFTEEDMKNDKFLCDRPLQRLGPTLSDRMLPHEVTQVYVFTTSEYSKCPGAVTGYVFNTNTHQLSKKVLNPSSDVSMVIDGELIGVSKDVLEFLKSSVGRRLLSKREVRSRSRSENGRVEREYGLSSCSRANIDGDWRARSSGEETGVIVDDVIVEDSDSEA